MQMNRREALKGVAGLFAAPLVLSAQRNDTIGVMDTGGTNVVFFTSEDQGVLVDSGVLNAPGSLGGSRFGTVFNTHYHLDHTGNNERYALSGAKIIAHQRTKQIMSVDYWVPDEERYEKARPKDARPTETFLDIGSIKVGREQIDYGYLPLAHTNGDIYVHFRNANLLAVGDVASPRRDPELDWYTGAWIGGRVDAMDTILKLADDQTKIVPGSGPNMTKAQFKAERDMMEEVRTRLFKRVREGDGPQDMLDGGVLIGLAREWKDPYKFLYAAAKGCWGHHDKLDANVV